MLPTPAARWSLLGLSALSLFAARFLFAVGEETPGQPSPTAQVRLAEGFDYPVGRPDGVGYHKARGFTPNGHLGDDWNKDGTTGDGDLGSPIYCTGEGVVVLAGNVHLGWGNVVMVRHSYREPREGNVIKTIDSLYGHLDTITVQVGQVVGRGQLVGTMGTGGGLYDAHLHFEIRKNIHIGMFRSSFAKDFSCYEDPTAFVDTHRVLRGGGSVMVALNTFRPTPGDDLPPADGGYELGINRSPAKVAEMNSYKLNKSAIELQRRRTNTTGNSAFDKINDSFKADRYGDLREGQKTEGRR